jgi:hypothetical protein
MTGFFIPPTIAASARASGPDHDISLTWLGNSEISTSDPNTVIYKISIIKHLQSGI